MLRFLVAGLLSGLSTASVSAQDAKLDTCINAKSLIESMLSGNSGRAKAWRTWEPQCARTGFYELTLAEYLAAEGRTEDARMVLEYGLALNSSYQNQLQSALDALNG